MIVYGSGLSDGNDHTHEDLPVLLAGRGGGWKPGRHIAFPAGTPMTNLYLTLLDRAGNIWVDANERNAVIVVTSAGKVIEVFRNAPDAGTLLRNGGPLEFNTSPVLSDRKFCTANLDAGRRDNFPPAAGEISPAGPNRGKISCMDQQLSIGGEPLPVR